MNDDEHDDDDDVADDDEDGDADQNDDVDSCATQRMSLYERVACKVGYTKLKRFHNASYIRPWFEWLKQDVRLGEFICNRTSRTILRVL